MTLCYLIGDAGLGKTTTFNFLTDSMNDISNSSLDGTFVSSTKSIVDCDKEIILTDTPGINDSKNLTTWWSDIHSNLDTNLILFFINGTTIRSSSNINLKSIIDFCKNMKYDFIFLFIHTIPKNLEELVPENIQYYKLKEIKEVKHDSIKNGDKITLGDLKNVLTNYDYKKSFKFISPIHVIKLHENIVNLTGKIIEDYNNISTFIETNKNDTEIILKTLEDCQELFNKIYNDVKKANDIKKQMENLLEERVQKCTKTIDDTLDLIKNIRSKFIVQNGNKYEKNIDNKAGHLYSWLPFIGNLKLYELTELQEYCSNEFMKIIDLEKTLKISGKEFKKIEFNIMSDDDLNQVKNLRKNHGTIDDNITLLRKNINKSILENVKFNEKMNGIRVIYDTINS